VIKYIDIDPGAAAVFKKLFLILHPEVMEQCNRIICVHAALLNLDILRHKTVHLLFQRYGACFVHRNHALLAVRLFTQLAVISLADGIMHTDADMFTSPEIVDRLLHQKRDASAVCLFSRLIGRRHKRKHSVPLCSLI